MRAFSARQVGAFAMEDPKSAMSVSRFLGAVALTLVVCIIGGCATVPSEAVAAQQLVIKNIEVARQNQLLLIDSYAEDRKDAKERELQDVALGQVLRDRLAGRAAMPPDEVLKFAKDYAADLNSEVQKIEGQARKLREKTNSDFDHLLQLAQINADYTSAMKERSDIVARLLGRYQKRLDEVQSEFVNAVNTK